MINSFSLNKSYAQPFMKTFNFYCNNHEKTIFIVLELIVERVRNGVTVQEIVCEHKNTITLPPEPRPNPTEFFLKK